MLNYQSRDQYRATMREGEEAYADAMEVLRTAGLPATFTQTGGMNAAIEVTLEAGATLLITDSEDSLPWDRDELCAWGVGLYRAGTDYADEFVESLNAELESLLAAVKVVLRSA